MIKKNKTENIFNLAARYVMHNKLSNFNCIAKG